MCEAIGAKLLGLTLDEFRWILRDCDHPVGWIKNKWNSRGLDPKGFWRVEKEKDPELRDAVLAQLAFQDLQSKGLYAFLTQNGGEGWMLPETVRLADCDLGHDQRARESQPVADALGPRFYDWQLEQTIDESWRECRLHAEVLAIINPVGHKKPEKEPEHEVPVGAPSGPFGNPIQTNLFGNVVLPKKGRR